MSDQLTWFDWLLVAALPLMFWGLGWVFRARRRSTISMSEARIRERALTPDIYRNHSEILASRKAENGTHAIADSQKHLRRPGCSSSRIYPRSEK